MNQDDQIFRNSTPNNEDPFYKTRENHLLLSSPRLLRNFATPLTNESYSMTFHISPSTHAKNQKNNEKNPDEGGKNLKENNIIKCLNFNNYESNSPINPSFNNISTFYPKKKISPKYYKNEIKFNICANLNN